MLLTCVDDPADAAAPVRVLQQGGPAPIRQQGHLAAIPRHCARSPCPRGPGAPTSTRCWPARCAGSSSPAPTPTSPPCSCACCAATGSTSSWPTSPPTAGRRRRASGACRTAPAAVELARDGRRTAGAAGARRHGRRAGRPRRDPRHDRIGARRGVLRRGAGAARVGAPAGGDAPGRTAGAVARRDRRARSPRPRRAGEPLGRACPTAGPDRCRRRPCGPGRGRRPRRPGGLPARHRRPRRRGRTRGPSPAGPGTGTSPTGCSSGPDARLKSRPRRSGRVLAGRLPCDEVGASARTAVTARRGADNTSETGGVGHVTSIRLSAGSGQSARYATRPRAQHPLLSVHPHGSPQPRSTALPCGAEAPGDPAAPPSPVERTERHLA